jgi:sodium-dependent dicarboxylate transporter 2/3/5
MGIVKDVIDYNATICIIGFLASMAFATPPSMPHIAIVTGSEYCNTKDVLIFGSVTALVAVVVVLIVGYPLGILFL